MNGALRDSALLERGLLGALLVKPALLETVAGIVQQSDFRSAINQTIFGAMLDLDADGFPCDTVSVYQRLAGDQEACSVVERLCDAVGENFELHSTPYYAEQLKRVGAMRALYRSVYDAEQVLRTGNPAVLEEAIGEVEAATDAVRRRLSGGADTTFRAAMSDTMAVLEDAARSNGRSHITTGIAGLDELLVMAPGKFTVIGARPSMGKSALAKDIALHCAKAGDGVVVFTLEDTKADWITRAMCTIGEVPLWRVTKTRLRDGDWDGLMEASVRMADWPLHVDDTASITVPEIRAQVKRLKRVYERRGAELRLVVVDYLQLIGATQRSGKDRGREQEVARMSQAIKAMGKSEGVHVLLLAQLNRECEKRADKRPVLSDLRESGSLEQDADAVCFVHRAFRYDPKADPEESEVIVAKQKNGPIGKVALRFSGDFVRFEDPAGGWA